MLFEHLYYDYFQQSTILFVTFVIFIKFIGFIRVIEMFIY